MSLWLTTKRVARYGLIGFIRNGFVSLAAIFIMTITLFIVVWMFIVGAGLHAALAGLQEKVDITVYFTTVAAESDMQELQAALQALPEVASVAYVSREQALAEFRERRANDQLTMQALEELEENPLGASLEIRAKDPSQYEAIAQYVETQQKSGSGVGNSIDKVNFFQNKTAIDRLSNFISTLRAVGLGVTLFFVLASLLIAFNTIRLAIYTSRDEIGVMNLVGATHWYVRGPFIIAGVLYGIVSGVIVLLAMYPLTIWLGPGSERFLETFNVFDYFTQQFPLLFLIVMGSGVALGALSSYLAIRRYLK